MQRFYKNITWELTKVRFHVKEDNQVEITGNYLEAYSFLPVALLFISGFIIPVFLNGGLFTVIIFILLLVISTLASLLGNTFSIQIGLEEVWVKKKYCGITIKTAKSPIEKVVVNRADFRDISCIYPYEHRLSEETKDYLQFSYIMPFDSDQDHIYIDYRSKDFITFWPQSEADIWSFLKQGFEEIDRLKGNNRKTF